MNKPKKKNLRKCAINMWYMVCMHYRDEGQISRSNEQKL